MDLNLSSMVFLYEIKIAHTIDNGTPRDTSPVHDSNTNTQMPEVNVPVSSNNNKYNEQDNILNTSIDIILSFIFASLFTPGF
jgi:hypothetical protein